MTTQVPDQPWFTSTGEPTKPLREFFDAVNKVEASSDVISDDFVETINVLEAGLATANILINKKSAVVYEDVYFTDAGVGSGVLWKYTANHTLGTANVGVCWFKDISNTSIYYRTATTANTIVLEFSSSFDPETANLAAKVFFING